MTIYILLSFLLLNSYSFSMDQQKGSWMDSGVKALSCVYPLPDNKMPVTSLDKKKYIVSCLFGGSAVSLLYDDNVIHVDNKKDSTPSEIFAEKIDEKENEISFSYEPTIEIESKDMSDDCQKVVQHTQSKKKSGLTSSIWLPRGTKKYITELENKKFTSYEKLAEKYNEMTSNNSLLVVLEESDFCKTLRAQRRSHIESLCNKINYKPTEQDMVGIEALYDEYPDKIDAILPEAVEEVKVMALCSDIMYRAHEHEGFHFNICMDLYRELKSIYHNKDEIFVEKAFYLRVKCDPIKYWLLRGKDNYSEFVSSMLNDDSKTYKDIHTMLYSAIAKDLERNYR